MQITDELIQLSGMNEHSLRQELALWLYSKGKLSLGRAAKFCGLNRIAFMELMSKHNIDLNYSVDDLEQDLQTIKKLGL